VDVVRHPLVQEVVRAYDLFDAERKRAKEERRAPPVEVEPPAGTLPGEPS
jgi:phosphate starvation-inducible PhoH-like protein